MKALATIIAATFLMAISALAQNADKTVTVDATQNVKIQLNPNGPLDANPTFGISGPGAVQVQLPTVFLFVTNGPGITTITFTGVSLGNAITNRVIVTVVAPPPPPTPATTLNPAITFVPK